MSNKVDLGIRVPVFRITISLERESLLFQPQHSYHILLSFKELFGEANKLIKS
ncbi:MAG: hypothetical protein ACTS8R_08840 [Arsenophonus sp. NC-QC1-MAG3]